MAEDTANSIEPKKAEWLKPYHFQPGKSGNPSGRPRKILTEALREELEKHPERAPRIANKLITQAENGHIQSFECVRDSIEGKPAQSVNIHGDIDFTVSDKRTRVAEALALLRGDG